MERVDSNVFKEKKTCKSVTLFCLGYCSWCFLTSLYSLLHPGQHKSSQIAVIDGDRLWQELPAMKQLKRTPTPFFLLTQKTFSRIENKLRKRIMN
ncbi:MAG: hypothetical protein H6925_05790 [Holosporaceae bacterium]|nr:MAG: hypothetical protein H6925_05790 [Holosporaceae bacterium]